MKGRSLFEGQGKMSFLDQVKEYFGFLETDHAFKAVVTDAHSVEYRSDALYVLIGWYKGEVDIDLYVQKDTSVLRPGQTKMFRLFEVVRRKDKHALERAPKFPNYITTDEDCAVMLKFSSKLMRHYCADILNGDIQFLEVMANPR